MKKIIETLTKKVKTNKKTQATWDRYFLGLALYYSTCSKDPSTKVGAVLVNDLKTPVGFGTNGFSRHSGDWEELLNDRQKKYQRTIHAEVNAIYNSTGDLRGTTAYITHPPCIPCVHHLSQNGITRIVFIDNQDEGFRSRFCIDESLQEIKELDMEYESYTFTMKDIDDLFGVLIREWQN